MNDIRVPRFARLDEYLGLWLAEPTAAQQFWQTVSGLNLAAHMAQFAEDEPAPLAAEMATAGNGQQVAVIRIDGAIMKQRSSFGGTSTVELRRVVRTAANDPAVSAILLNIDSPGGTVSGLEEAANEIKAAGKRKPVWTQVEDLTASAAYWLASQTQRIFANAQTALVGSIGTYLTVYDQSGAAAMEGVRVLHFATGPLKGAGQLGTLVSPQQAEYFQGIVNGVQQEFDRAVKAGRGLTAPQLEAVRTGGVWKAPEAQALGLIDGVQGVDRTIDQLARAAAGQPEPPGRRRAGVIPTISLGVLPTLKRGATL